MLNPAHSIALKLIKSLNQTDSIGPAQADRILRFESRWHVSQHLLAERRGEEVIADLLKMAPTRRVRAILEAQANDEKRHAKLYTEVADRIGVDDRARYYSDAYHELILAQTSLSEKAFVFQILTESVSEAYCLWRLTAYDDSHLNQVDTEVAADESRHLDMGRSLLLLVDADERATCLNKKRQRELLGQMANICKFTSRSAFGSALADELRLPLSDIQLQPSELDFAVAKSMIQASRTL